MSTTPEVVPGIRARTLPRRRTVKVRITTTYEVDIDQWSTEYGVDATAKAVREDVQNYGFGTAVPDHLAQIVTVL